MSSDTTPEKVQSAEGPPTDAALLLNSIAELCLGSMSSVSPRKQAELDAILKYVAETMKFRERLALATAVSAMDHVPASVAGIFLNDVYAVAQPIIENLAGLEEALLVGLANRNDENYLFSIAKRRIVPIKLTDIIVDKGQNPSVFTVARNRGAQFSIRGFGRLIVRAQSEITLQNILASRTDMPAEISVQLKTIVALRTPKPAGITVEHSPASSERSRQGWALREKQSPTALDELRAKLLHASRQ